MPASDSTAEPDVLAWLFLSANSPPVVSGRRVRVSQTHPAFRDPYYSRTSSSLPLGSDSQAVPFTASSTHSPVVSTAEEVGTTPTVPLHVSRPPASAVVVSTSVVDVVSAGDNSHPSLPVACTDAAAPASAVVADARAASALSKTLSTVIAVVDHALSHTHSVSIGTARFTPGNNTSARPSALEYHRRLPDADKLAVRSDQAHQRALRSRKRSALGIAAATTRAPASSNSALSSAAPQASTATPPLNSVSALMGAKVGPGPPVDSSLASTTFPPSNLRKPWLVLGRDRPHVAAHFAPTVPGSGSRALFLSA